ncbi:M6 family metalloprotease domain-containing protein [candidate division CSSED10-310 bacterium]|uniref:M6 family metalloprotease domain-containing protein n=1 Tax=candidate division CSSED10-310 bacterium TaxID=2855610 RepID=A0ABV6YTE5_UNCC1
MKKFCYSFLILFVGLLVASVTHYRTPGARTCYLPVKSCPGPDLILNSFSPPDPDHSGSLTRIAGNHRVHPIHAQRLHYKLKKAALQNKGLSESEAVARLGPPPFWQGLPTTGDVNTFALLIEFPEYPHIPEDTVTAIEASLFGDGIGAKPPSDSLRNFYLRASYNRLNIQGTVMDWYTTGYPRSEIPETSKGYQDLIKEVILFYDQQGHDFSIYDNDGDGEIEYFMVIWSGPPSSSGEFWAGQFMFFFDKNFTVDGKSLDGFSWQDESGNYPKGHFRPGICIHETGHGLGLPDFYDYDPSVGPKGGVGGYDQMDVHGGGHNCFSKYLLDWIEPTIIFEGSHSVTLRSSALEGDALLVMPDATGDTQYYEFFMIQNRFRVAGGNDVHFPGDGLQIWHVDATLNEEGTNFEFDNSFTEHKLIRLMEADGLEEIETNAYGGGDEGDYYTSENTFTMFTTPNSFRYNGERTYLSVWDISATAEVMSLKVKFDIYSFPDPPNSTP